MKYEPHDYQHTALTHLLGNRCAALFLDPGLGKTVISLTTFAALKQLGLVDKCMIFAPLRVCQCVWPDEVAKWDHTKHLTVSLVHGTPKQRIAALNDDADIYLINADGARWLKLAYEASQLTDKQKQNVYYTCELNDCTTRKQLHDNPEWAEKTPSQQKYATRCVDLLPLLGINWPDCQVAIFDELTDYRGNQRWRAIKGILNQFWLRWGLTGTPTPKSIGDLWPQIYLLDEGERLGTTLTEHHQRWFVRGGFENRDWVPKGNAFDGITEAISDICLSMSAQDHLSMPALVEHDIMVNLPPRVLKEYKRLAKGLEFNLDDGSELVPLSQGAKYMLCRQVANGCAYATAYYEAGEADPKVVGVHDAKIDALAELVNELNGKPIMVAYQFYHDLWDIQGTFGEVPAINGNTADVASIVKDWNAGKLPMLCVQPQAMSHGLNMQTGGHDIAWFGLTDDMGIYQQLIARVWRQGVTKQVRVHRILAKSTVDEVMAKRLRSKAADQSKLLEVMK